MSLFNEAVSGYLQQLNNLHNLEQWSKEVLYYSHLHIAEPEDRKKYGWDNTYVYGKLYNKVANLIKKEAPTAFNNILRFHKLEYKLYILKTEYPEQKVYIKKVEGEMNLLFEYIKVFMTTIIRTRLDYDTKYTNKYSKEDYIKVANESITSGRGKFNYVKCYELLMNAKTLKEKIFAVQVSLNTYHDNGKIFGVATGENDEPFFFTPFTTEQFDQFHVDGDKIERELKKELK